MPPSTGAVASRLARSSPRTTAFTAPALRTRWPPAPALQRQCTTGWLCDGHAPISWCRRFPPSAFLAPHDRFYRTPHPFRSGFGFCAARGVLSLRSPLIQISKSRSNPGLGVGVRGVFFFACPVSETPQYTCLSCQFPKYLSRLVVKLHLLSICLCGRGRPFEPPFRLHLFLPNVKIFTKSSFTTHYPFFSLHSELLIHDFQ